MSTILPYHMSFESPVGNLDILANDDQLTHIFWPDHKGAQLPRTRSGKEHPVLLQAKEQLEAYFAGELQVFDLPVYLEGTDFQKEVWTALMEIAWGETWTYSQLAHIIGRPKAVRAVGAANGRNPISIVIPCHRVIGANGTLTGYAGGLECKRWLLQHEGFQEQAHVREPKSTTQEAFSF